jgi:hypothetical protein
MCDMTIRSRQTKGGTPVTTLTGRLTDQASLMGILTALYEMGYALLDVKRLPVSSSPEPVTGSDNTQRGQAPG